MEWNQTVWEIQKADAVVFISWMSFLFVMGIVGNLLILRNYPWRQKNSVNIGLFIKALTITDLVSCVVIIPYSVLFELGLVQIQWVCKLSEMLRFFLVSFSNFLFVACSVERFLCICRPLKKLSFEQSTKLLIALVTLSLAVCWPAALIYTLYSQKARYYKLSQVSCFPVLSTGSTVFGVMLLMVFVTSSVIMLIMYSLIFTNIVRNNAKIHVHRQNDIQPSKSNSSQLHTAQLHTHAYQQKTLGQNQVYSGRLNKQEVQGRGSSLQIQNQKVQRIQVQCRQSNTSKNIHTDGSEIVHKTEQGESSVLTASSITSPDMFPNRTIRPSSLFSVVDPNSPVRKCDPQKADRHSNEASPRMPSSGCLHMYPTARISQRKKNRVKTRKGHCFHCIKVVTINNRTKLVLMVFGTSVVYILSWIPFWLQKLDLIPYQPIGHYFFFFNNSTNIFIYLMLNSKFRNNFRCKSANENA